jgi:hypothetical protein
MVDINKLRAQMALKGFTQGMLVEEMNNRGVKTSENTLSNKMNRKTQFDCEDADVICNILGVEDAAQKAEIFLA